LKKGISIGLLLCFLSYHFGYYFLYISLQQIEYQWQHKIFDDQFSQELILNLPLSIPYMADQEDYQVTNTPFTKDGVHYRVIKQRYANDTLQLIYVPDHAVLNIKTSMKDWIAAIHAEGKPSQSNGKLIFLNAYKDFVTTVFNFLSVPFKLTILHSEETYYFPYKWVCLWVDSPPPEFS